jgi:hypothetical protein
MSAEWHLWDGTQMTTGAAVSSGLFDVAGHRRSQAVLEKG